MALELNNVKQIATKYLTLFYISVLNALSGGVFSFALCVAL